MSVEVPKVPVAPESSMTDEMRSSYALRKWLSILGQVCSWMGW
jgi:hypothetical protein